MMSDRKKPGFYSMCSVNGADQMGRYLCVCFVLAGLTVIIGSPTQAQESQEVADPEVIELTTTDNVLLKCEYYPGRNEKETIPVILLHSWNDDRKSMLSLAGYLQRQFGHAVLVPDLRGHGGSLKTVNQDDELDKDRWGKEEIAAMVEDIEACKKFLVKKNNDGELNIDMLTLVAERETTIHAVAWTLRDWSYPVLGGIKQGQDVKALVFIAPKRSFKGLSAVQGLKHPLFTGRGPTSLPMMIAADSRSSREAKKMFDNLERNRKAGGKTDSEMDYVRFSTKNLQMVVKTKDQGTRPLNELIGQFIKDRVEAKKHEFRWQDRSAN